MKKAALTAACLATFLAAPAFAQDNPAPPPPADGQPATTTTPATAPTPEGTPATPQTGATVSLTGPSTGTPDQGAAPAPAAPKEKPRPWAGTQLFVQQALFTGTFAQGQQQTANGRMDTSFFLLPRYTLNKDFQLRGRLVVTVDENFTAGSTQGGPNGPGSRVRLSDSIFSVFYRGIPKVAGFKPNLTAQAAIPTSTDSRVRNTVVTPGVGAQVFRVVEVGSGEIDLLGAATFTHPIYTRSIGTTPDDPQAVQCSGGGQGCFGQITGTNNVANGLSWTALVAGSWGKWAPALFLLGVNQWAYDNPDVKVSDVVPGVQSDALVQRQANRTNFRQSLYFSAWLDYEANSWLTAEVGYFMFRPLLNADATIGNPFWARYQDTRVYLGANFNIDNMVKKFIEGEHEAEAGVIRAKNTRTGPAVNFF